jgi:N-acetylneuraminic acid mutarotase
VRVPQGAAGRWALAALVAAAAGGILFVADGDEANGGPEATTAAGWSSLQSSPLSRTEVGAARIDSFIYVVGGFLAPNGDTTDKVARYDIVNDRWEQVAPMPVGVNHPAIAALGGKLYVHGGYRADGGLADETDALQRYDPASGTWATLSPSGFPRAAHTLAPVGERLFAIGGAHDGGKPLRLVQVYDVEDDRWRGGRRMPTPREHLASAVVGRRIFVLAGRAGGENLDIAERFDTRKGKWTELSPLIKARSGFGAATAGGRIVAVGGEELAEGSETIRSVELYDPKAKKWRRLPGMITPRHGLGVAAQGRRVFALEGGPQPGLAFSSALEVLRVPRG